MTHTLTFLMTVVPFSVACHRPAPPIQIPPPVQFSPLLARGDIRGLVLDSSTGAPLTYALVDLSPDTIVGTVAGMPNSTMFADWGGEFVLHGVKPGTYTLRVGAVLYRFKYIALLMPDSGGVIATIALARDPEVCEIWPDLCE